MYLHLGQNVMLEKKRIIGIFDLDNTSYSKITRTFLAEAEKELTALGWQVINPSKNPGTSYKDYIDTGLFELMKCDAIFLLDGWEKSDGANLEYVYAVTTGMDIYMSRKQALKLEMDTKTRIKNKYRRETKTWN